MHAELVDQRYWRFRGEDLWCVVFTLSAISLIKLMSGLVDIFEVDYDGDGCVLFYVRCTDTSNTLFRKGFIRAQAFDEMNVPVTPLVADARNYALTPRLFN